MEQWKQIPGFEGIYDISNLGNIRMHYDIKKGRPKLNEQVPELASPRLVPIHKHTTGYIHCTIRGLKGKRKKFYIHQLVAKVFLRPPPDASHRWVINHIDGDKNNANASNLEWVSDSQNAKHRVPGKCETLLINKNPKSAARTIAKKYSKDDIKELIEELKTLL